MPGFDFERLRLFQPRRGGVAGAYSIALGVFLAVSPWLFACAQGLTRGKAWIGAALVVLSVTAIVAFAAWEEWLNVVIGLWIVVSPWVLGVPYSDALRISVAVGILVSYMAALPLCLAHLRRVCPRAAGKTR